MVKKKTIKLSPALYFEKVNVTTGLFADQLGSKSNKRFHYSLGRASQRELRALSREK